MKDNMLKMNLQKFTDDIAGYLSKGTALSYKSSGSTFTPVAAVKSVPAMGSDPEKVDVTHLQSEKKAYIAGIQDTDNLEFAIIYQGSNFAKLKTLCDAGTSTDFKVTYPDGMEVTFTGTPSLKLDGTEVNGALGFSLVVVVSKGPDFTPAT